MNYIISWLYLEEEGNESTYLQVNAKSTSRKFKETYWKCIISFYYASIKVNKEANHLFYTNSNELPVIDGFNTLDFFNNNNIQVIKLELTNRTPSDWHSAWRNQFYVFDILKDLNGRVSTDDSIIILDSDCIINNNLITLFEEIKTNGLVSYLIGYENNHIINGVSTDQMQDIYKDFYNQPCNVQYYGGEFIGVKGEHISKILIEYKQLWNINFKNYQKKLLKLNEEAHFLSFIYHRINLANCIGNKYIKRIWNGFNYNNVNNSDENLVIFHLPAQKTTGFNYFFKNIVIKNKNYSKDELVKIFDIKTKKSPARRGKEMLTKVIFKLVN